MKQQSKCPVSYIIWSVYRRSKGSQTSHSCLPILLTKPSAPIRPLPDTLKVTSASQLSKRTLFFVHMEPLWLRRDGVIRTWSALGIAPMVKKFDEDFIYYYLSPLSALCNLQLPWNFCSWGRFLSPDCYVSLTRHWLYSDFQLFWFLSDTKHKTKFKCILLRCFQISIMSVCKIISKNNIYCSITSEIRGPLNVQPIK